MASKSSSQKPELILVADYVERFIWFEGEELITHSLASGIISILNKLNRISDQPITFFISGPGGDVYAFLKIAHAIEKLKSPVVFIAFDYVRSGCFMITQCGKACFGVAGTKFMFHRAVHSWSGEMYMSQKDYLRLLRELMLIDAIQFMAFTKRGSPVKTVLKLFEQEAALSVEQAVALNFAAGIYEKDYFNKYKKMARKLARKKYDF